jgi:copper(I)-binding protein
MMTHGPSARFHRLACFAAVLAAFWVVAAPGAGAGHKDHGLTASGQAKDRGGITVAGPWARASAGRARNGAAYFTVLNKGAKTDRLIGVQTPIAKKAQLHEHRASNGVMRMRRVVGGLTVAPGGRLSFAPRGRHVMLMGLGKPLKAGDGFPLTLVFERAGRITVNVAIHPIGGSAPVPKHRHK